MGSYNVPSDVSSE